ncbi:putative ribosome-binding factor A, mitochondrial [Cylas formicarius]|uniref:putative ribosome-binding factor A, mitochondrial n=1 Tax=Cylas formicarius TaxID=197179 RepID=UPI002958A323|nr:putative ribosome-binding factor A, mitochondrial [Cylas formicarius]
MIRNYLSRCTFHTTRQIKAKPARIMGKVMGFARKKKHYFESSSVLPSTGSLSVGSFETKITGSSKRSFVLNKLFMRHITDLMATGEYSDQIVGLGVEINKVKITMDYKILKVYWVAKANQDENTTEELLRKTAGSLRHELSQLRVLGVVPNIIFVKDRLLVNASEVESRLSIADFGEDHIPIDPADLLKTEFHLWTTLNSDTKQKVRAQETPLGASEVDELPYMPQNVLGLDHADIMDRIKKAIKKSKAGLRKRSDEWSRFKVMQPINQNPVSYKSNRAQREAFKEFLMKRELMRAKLNKGDKNWTPDQEYWIAMARDRHLEDIETPNEDIEDEDFIDEEPEGGYLSDYDIK